MRFLLLTLLLPVFISAQTQIGNDLYGESPGDTFGEAVAMSSNGQIIAVASPIAGGINTESGITRVYQNNVGTWEQLGQDIEGEAENDGSGSSVALSSDGAILAVGARINNMSGHVRVYQFTNDVWNQLGQDIDGEAQGDAFGFSVALASDGSTVAIGGRTNDGNGSSAGHVRVFQYNGNSWSQIGSDIDGEMAGDESGFSVDISADGSIVAIGATSANDNNGSDIGHVRVFQNINDIWTQVGQDIDGEAPGDLAGVSVSLSSNGQIVAIGARQNNGNGNNSGHVRVFENNNGSWVQLGQDIDGENSVNLFGTSVSISENGLVLAAGAYLNDDNGTGSGHVRVYQYDDSSTWQQLGKDIDGDNPGDILGTSVALSGDGTVVVVGAPGNDFNGDVAGQAKVFDLSELLALQVFNGATLKIYPNPTREGFYIQVPNNTSLKKVTLYTSQGQRIITKTTAYIPTNTLAKGVYLVKITTSKGSLVRKVVVD